MFSITYKHSSPAVLFQLFQFKARRTSLMERRSNDCTPGSLLSGPAFSFGSHRQQVRRLPRPREAICRPMCRAPGDRVLLNAAQLHTFIEQMASFSFGEDDDLHDAPGPGLLRLRRWRLPHCYVRWLMREKT
jgi:hypothetical protein